MAAQRPIALVTGASAGIGAAFARALALRRHDVVLVARRLERLEALAAELRERHEIAAHPIAADLSIVDAHAPIMAALAERGLTAIDVLINNAGFSVPKTYAATDWVAQRDFVMTLVMAVCGLTHALLPGMLARGRGRIITVGSMAGLSPGGAGHTLYPAAKSFVHKFSMSLDAEVRARGLKVSCVLPGFTESEFQTVNGMDAVLDKVKPPTKPMKAEEVAEIALRGNEAGRVTIIPGATNMLAAGLMRYLPDEIAAPLIQRAAKKYQMPD